VRLDGKIFLGENTEIKLDELVAKLTAVTAARGGMESGFSCAAQKIDYGTVMRVMAGLSARGKRGRCYGNGAGDLTALKIGKIEDRTYPLAASIALHIG